MKMFDLKVSGFKTKAQVEMFISWYEGCGEQDFSLFLECRKEEGVIDVDCMNTDIRKTYPIKWEGDVAHLIVEPS